MFILSGDLDPTILNFLVRVTAIKKKRILKSCVVFVPEIVEPPSSSLNSTVNKSDDDESHLSDLKNLSALETDDSLNGNDDQDVTSRTNSSPDTSDHDITTGELSHDDSTENIEGRERRDSGVGSSLTRAPRYKLM